MHGGGGASHFPGPEGELSGCCCILQVADLGSLNGTLLNGEPISQARKRGRDYRLSSDDILQVGVLGFVECVWGAQTAC